MHKIAQNILISRYHSRSNFATGRQTFDAIWQTILIGVLHKRNIFIRARNLENISAEFLMGTIRVGWLPPHTWFVASGTGR